MGDKFNSVELDVVAELNDEVKTDEQSDVKILGLLPVIVLLSILGVRLIFLLYKYRGQKTRIPQQRRPYIGTRARTSLTPQEPTIYVSPANLPPPPKYEAMAPPSYEEVVGVHYPGYQSPVQPINAPINAAMAQSGNSSSNSNQNTSTAPPTVISVTTDTRSAVTVATS